MTKFLHEGLIINLPSLADSLSLQSSKFEVTKVLDGGMGTCAQIKACDGSIYALKMIHSDKYIKEESMQRYIEEMKKWLLLSACNGVVEALMIVRVNEIPCIVSQWMQGGDLTKQIKLFNRDLFYKTIDRVATTLQWAYEKHHIIHRDLKPSNILLDEYNNAYIADWGLAKDISQHIEENNGTIATSLTPFETAEGVFMGTVAYAAPEQIMGRKDIDFRADIYSLGCIMYEWETGHLPFQGKTFDEIASQQIYSQPQQIQSIYGSTKYNVEKIITKCLQKYPQSRYQSYDDFLKDLRQVASENAIFTPFKINERYRVAKIGVNEFQNRLNNNDFKHIVRGSKGNVLLTDDEIEPYLKEAQALSDLGKYKESISLLRRFYVKDIFVKCPDDYIVTYIAINLGWNYLKLHKEDDAIDCFLSIKDAKNKPATYYSNIGCCYINKLQFEEAKDISLEGLKFYPKDSDLQGNLTIAYTHLDMLDEAMLSAQKRLRMGRDLHALTEAAGVCVKLGNKYENHNFPLSIDNYKTALTLYKEAIQLNPQHLDTKRNISNTLFYMQRYADSMQEIVDVTQMQHGSSPYEIWIMARIYLHVGLFKNAIDICNKYIPQSNNLLTALKRVRAEAMVDGFVINHVNKDGYKIIDKSSLEFFETIVNNENERTASDIKFLGRYYMWMSDDDPELRQQAFDLFEWGKELYPNEWRFDFHIAAYYNQFGMPKQALPYIQEAIKKAPWREISYDVCERIYSNLGDTAKAQEMQDKAKEIKAIKDKLYAEAKQV